jgi:CubicO group peptidase (beta-lactamase class C family)
MGGADMVSCVQDYARFLQMIMNKGELDGVTILSKKTVEMLERPLFDVHSDEAVAKSFIGSEQVQAGMSVVHVPKAKTDFGLLSPGSYFWGGYFNTLFTVDRNENMFILLLSQVAPDQSNHHNKARHLAWASIVD